jgi:uncharacterized protein
MEPMHIDWAHFTPGSALVGGLLIGLAAAGLVIVNGRILGAAGILGGLLPARAGDAVWRLGLLAGLVVAPLVARVALEVRAPVFDAGAATLVVGGLLVGFGTRLGSGCTSGHGVCGLARVSPRSLIATLVFMAAGFATVFVVRHIVQ